MPSEGQADPITVTASYAGATGNMTGKNDAATIGLDATVFTAIGSASSGNNNNVGLNKDGTIRFYKGGNTLKISCNGTIQTIKISFKTNGGDSYVWVKVGDTVVQGSNGVYTINASEFILTSAGTGASGTISINSIEITYIPN